jgi:hypothetical protein
VLAALELCVDYARHKRLDEADVVFQDLTARFRPEEIVAYIPADVASQLLDLYSTMSGSSAYFQIHPDPDRIQKRERLLTLQKLVSAPRRDIVDAQKLLLNMLLDDGRLSRAKELAQDLIDDESTDPRERCATFDPYTRAAVQAGAQVEALRVINRYLPDDVLKIPKESLGLLVWRSRLDVANNDWAAATKDIDAYFACAEHCNASTLWGYASHAALVKGFLVEKQDPRAAEAIWKRGYEASRARGELGTVCAAMLGSLGNAVTPDDADAMLATVLDGNKTGSSNVISLLRQHVVPSAQIAWHLRNMWRTRHGREYARQLAFGQLPYRLDTTAQVMLTLAEIFRYVVQNSESPHELTADEDEVLWSTSQDLFAGVQKRALNEMAAVQYYMALRGNMAAWDALAPTLDPRYRGPLAYVLGRRYVHLKRSTEAATIFHTAATCAPVGSKLRRLVDAELKKLEQPAPAPHEPVLKETAAKKD